MIEVEEVYYQWLKGVSLKGISRSLGISRNTVKKLIVQAGRLGLTRQSSVEEIARLRDQVLKPVAVSKERAPIQTYISQHHLQIEAWHQMSHMTVTQMVRLLKEQCVLVSETSLRRYVRHHFGALPLSTVHLETVAGRQGQVDFGCCGFDVGFYEPEDAQSLCVYYELSP